MNKLILIALIFFTIILQISLIPALHPLGVVPNLLLILIILLAINTSATRTLISALIMGLSMDLASGCDFGLRMTFFCFISIAIILLKQIGLKLNSFWLATLLIMTSTIIYDLSIIANLNFLHTYISLGLVTKKIFTELVINSLIAACLYRPFKILFLNSDSQSLLRFKKK